MICLSKKRGLTAIELLVSISIFAILAVIIISSFAGFRESTVLNAETENIITFLSEGRRLTLGAKDGSQYGVHIESARLVLFKGAMFAEPSADNKELLIDSAVTISGISLNGGGSDILFQKLTGETSQYGTLVLSVNSSGASKTINIYETGIIDIE